MKKALKFLMTFILLAGISCQEKIDIEKEKEAVKAVIEEETSAFLNKDISALAKTYIQDESNIRLTAGKSGYSYLLGWEKIGSTLESWIDSGFVDIKNIKFEKSDYKIKVYQQSAWAVFEERTDYDYQGKHVQDTAISVRFLEKENDKWKIVYLSSIGRSSYSDKEPQKSDVDSIVGDNK